MNHWKFGDFPSEPNLHSVRRMFQLAIFDDTGGYMGFTKNPNETGVWNSSPNLQHFLVLKTSCKKILIFAHLLGPDIVSSCEDKWPENVKLMWEGRSMRVSGFWTFHVIFHLNQKTHRLHGAGIVCLHLDDFVRANVGKSSSTMEHLG